MEFRNDETNFVNSLPVDKSLTSSCVIQADPFAVDVFLIFLACLTHSKNCFELTSYFILITSVITLLRYLCLDSWLMELLCKL